MLSKIYLKNETLITHTSLWILLSGCINPLEFKLIFEKNKVIQFECVITKFNRGLNAPYREIEKRNWRTHLITLDI